MRISFLQPQKAPRSTSIQESRPQKQQIPSQVVEVTIFIILISTYVVNASVLDPVIENVIHLKASKPPPGVSGIWKKKTIWKPRWVKEWKSAKVMKPVWRKVWSPVQIREWLPIPKPPPGWDLNSTPLIQLQPKPQKSVPVKDSQGHDSFAVHSSAPLPLWDPVPYPESQQPPPLPVPQSYEAGNPCGNAGCDNSPSFSHQQISEIIGPKYQTPEPYQNQEYSETVNHLMRLTPDGRPQFNGFSPLPEFLVPPKFQTAPENNFRQQIPNLPANHSPPFEPVPKWTPLPPENKVRGHFITKAPDQPYKFQFPEPQNNTSSVQRDVLPNSNVGFNEKPKNVTLGLKGDFIQEAQLVGEYHYSEFDLPAIKPEPRKPQQQEKEVKVKLQQKTKPPDSAPKAKPIEAKPKRTEQSEVKVQGGTHVQKKHVPDSSWNLPNTNLNFQQQEAIIKEIFPIFKHLHNPNQTRDSKPPPSTNPEKLLHNQSTKLHPVTPNPETNSSNDTQRKKQIYPVYERTNASDELPDFFPANHRFSPLEVKPSPTNATTAEPPKGPKPERPSFEKSSIVQLVFPTTVKEPAERPRTTTTTEPYEIVFSSSLLSTTEAVTKSPVFVVTPASSRES